MDMDGWRDILHFDFHGEHVLFSSLRLSSGFTFLVASVLTVFLCLLEKYLTYLLSSKYNPISIRHSRLGNAAFRTAIYWVLTLIRLLYMLLAMTFHVGLILVVVTTLSAGQFAIEYVETRHPHLKANPLEGAPLLSQEGLESHVEYLDLPSTSTTTRPLATSSYPPRKKAAAKAFNDSGAANSNENGTTIFAIDEDDAA
ncbi:hypothetical protein JB92DRAFT_3104134 [Gautieria morchelliformis]|nr:hypothetical protein JB92DRAFT_3104134 [Gautieria morchelliformis]